MVSMYQGNKCGTPCSVILGNLLKGAHRSPFRDYCNHNELNDMLIEFIKRLIVLINRLIELFDMLGEFITAFFINGLIQLIDRLVIGLNELILTLTFL